MKKQTNKFKEEEQIWKTNFQEQRTKTQNQMQNPIKKFVHSRKSMNIKTLTDINQKCHKSNLSPESFQTKSMMKQSSSFVPIKSDLPLQSNLPLLSDLRSNSGSHQSSDLHQSSGLQQSSGTLLLEAQAFLEENYIKEVMKNQQQYKRSLRHHSVIKYKSIKISPESFLQVRNSSVHDQYQFKEKVGEGAYGTVFRAICKKSREERAIKMLKAKYLKGDNKQKFLAEMTLLSKLQHPSIIKIYNLFKNENNYYVVMQFCGGGSVLDIMKQKNLPCYEKIVMSIMKQIFSALSYMHSKNIVHRDMKLDNIVFLGNQNIINDLGEVRIRIIDFGTAVETKYKLTKNYEVTGTYSYMAPEVFDKILTEKSDIWSSAVIMAFLLTGVSPFKGVNQQKTIQKINNKQINYSQTPFDKLSEDAKSLLKLMFNRNLYKRISASQALKHPFFSSSQKLIPICIRTADKLMSFEMQNNFISVIESFLIIKKTNQEQRQYYTNLFNYIDTDNSGTIEINEFNEMMRQTQNNCYDEEELKQLLDSIDKDKQGRIDLNEFMAAMYNREKLFVRESLSEAFDYFDKDKSGLLEKKEMKNLLKGSNNSEVEYFLQKIDTDKNNEVWRQEFIKYLTDYLECKIESQM